MGEYSSHDRIHGNLKAILIVFSLLEHQDVYLRSYDNIFFQFQEMKID